MKAFLAFMYFVGIFLGALLLVYLVMHGKSDEARDGAGILLLFMIGGGLAMGNLFSS